MTVSSTQTSIEFTGDGTTTEFDYPYRVITASDVLPYFNGAQQVAGYVNTLINGGHNGVRVTFYTPPANGIKVLLDLNIPATQDTDYVENDPFPAEVQETALDKLTLLIQQEGTRAQRGLSSAIRVPLIEAPIPELPGKATRVGKYLSFDADGDPLLADLAVGVLGQAAIAGSIALLRSITILPLVGPVYARVEGYYGPGTLGGGEFYFDAASLAADDGGRVIKPNSIGGGSPGRWVRLIDPLGFGNPSMYGAVGDGVTNDTTAVQAAFAAFQRVELPVGAVYLVTGNITMATNQQVLRGPGTIQLNKPTGGAAGQTCSLIINGNRCDISGITVIGNALERPALNPGIQNNGSFNCIHNCRITGTMREYIYSVGGSYNTVDDNFLDGETYYSSSGIVFSGIYDAVGGNHIHVYGNAARNNRLHWVRGFGIQTRLFCHGTVITGNTCDSPYVTFSGSSATGGQTIWIFTAPWFPNRYGVRINGVPIDPGLYTITRATGSFTVTLTMGAAQPDGTVPTIFMFFSLESINVNSQSYNTLVANNFIDGSGDSGIVTGSDYHNGVINPGATTSAEYPQDIRIDANTVRNCNFAAVAMTVATLDTTITNNNCSDWSLGILDGVYSAGIVCTGRGLVSGNHMIGNGVSTRYAITHNGSVPTGSLNDDGKNGTFHTEFGNNTFTGTFTSRRINIPTSSTTARKTGILITESPFIAYPGQIDIDTAFTTNPVNTPYLAYTANGGGWVQEAVDKNGGSFSVTATGSGADAYMDFVLLMKAALLNCNIRVSFMAKALTGTGGFFRIFTDLIVAGAPVTFGPVLSITDTTWQRYSYLLGITNAQQVDPLSTIRCRAGANNGNSVRFQHFRIDYQRIPL